MTVSAATHTAAGLITCGPARSAAAIAEHHAIRHQVFVVEQAIFAGSDADAHDDDPAVIRLLGRYEAVAAGSVRLFELEPGRWQGDRLAVLPPYRVLGLGAPLVRCAVALAGAAGGSTMVAHIQLPNVGFFTRLGWHAHGDVEIYAGRPHQPMAITLPAPADGARIAAQLHAGIRTASSASSA
jgi:putative N-acetyltransferase (TIGR04045 family)